MGSNESSLLLQWVYSTKTYAKNIDTEKAVGRNIALS